MKKYILHILIAIMAFVGCTPTVVETNIFATLADEIKINCYGGDIVLEVDATIDWDLLSSESWATPSVRSNEDGNQSVIVTVNNNATFEERSATITIGKIEYDLSYNITIIQSGITLKSDNVIAYTSSEEKVVTPYSTDAFGANIVSNTYSNGQGVIVFDAPVTSIGGSAFSSCSSLTSVTIPSSVTSIGYNAFSRCRSLTSITIPNSVTKIGDNAFWHCSSLTSITIPDSVTSIGDYAFDDCSSLTSVTIGNSVTSIGRWAFSYCRSLASITIPDSVTKIGVEAFSNCSSLTAFYGKFASPDNRCLIVNGVLNSFAIGCGATEYTIPNSVTSIGGEAFSECRSLTSVTIPNSVTSIGDYAFDDCSSLTSVTIGNSVTSIGRWAFKDCSSLTDLHISNLSAWCKIDFADKSTNPLRYAENFYLNGKLVTELTIPSDVTEIKEYTFDHCRSLTSVIIPDSVTSIGRRAFYYCSSLTSVTIGNSVTSIGDYAFYNCISLKAFYGKFASSDNRCLIVDGVLNSFAIGCGATEYTIPNSVTSIGGSAFSGCSSLTSVTIPDSVTSIGGSAFSGCSSLTSVTIGNSVTSIGQSAFYGCTSLASVYCRQIIPPMGGDDMFMYYNIGADKPIGCKIYVPTASVDAYKAASGWSRYKSSIVGYDF